MSNAAFSTPWSFCCGLTTTIDGDQVTDIRGDSEDVFSHGYICPKGVALGELHSDPQRLTQPMIRLADGTLVPSTWDEAFDLIRERLGPILRDHGPSVETAVLLPTGAYCVTKPHADGLLAYSWL